MKILSKEIMPYVKELLDMNKAVELKVSGNSMLPFFKHHETIVHLSKKQTYNTNDVILYLNNDSYILHRIYKQKNNYFIVFGDALKTKEIVYPSQILGFVEFHVKNGKQINSNSKRYLFKVKLWKLLKPFRKPLLLIIRKFKLI